MSQVNTKVCLLIQRSTEGSNHVIHSSAHQKIHNILLSRQQIFLADVVLLRSVLIVVLRASPFSTCPSVNMVIILTKDLVIMKDDSL